MSDRDCAQTYLCRSETVPKLTYVGQRLGPNLLMSDREPCPNLLMSDRDWAQTYLCRAVIVPKPTHVELTVPKSSYVGQRLCPNPVMTDTDCA